MPMDLVLVAPLGAILRCWAILTRRYRRIKVGFRLRSRHPRSPPSSMGRVPAGVACNDANVGTNRPSRYARRERLCLWVRPSALAACSTGCSGGAESAFTLASQVSHKNNGQHSCIMDALLQGCPQSGMHGSGGHPWGLAGCRVPSSGSEMRARRGMHRARLVSAHLRKSAGGRAGRSRAFLT